jgi:N-glycosidase YbiA
MSETPTIRFYETSRPYGCFSNFARVPLRLDGVEWPTSEHAFQARKFTCSDDRERIRQAPTPFVAADMGRDRSRALRPDWDMVRDDVMREVLAAKFDQHASLRDVLLSTGECHLVEHTANDRYWGDGGDGTGKNRLGELLMEVRATLSPAARPFILPPWVAYPGVEVSDLHWRMGGGEDYLMSWTDWCSSLSEAARREYDSYFPVPAEWARSV